MTGRSARAAGLAALMLMPSLAPAQQMHNVFFGFDFVLHPLAVKWACGGDAAPDLRQIKALAAAFPKDAETANLMEAVTTTLTVATGGAGLQALVGAAVSPQQAAALCAVALPLTINGVTPRVLATGDDATQPQAERRAWRAFFAHLEDMHEE